MELFGIVLNQSQMAALFMMGTLIALGLRESWKAWRFVSASVQTRGEVVAYESREEEARNEDGTYRRTVYSQVIRYTDRDGVTRTFNGPATGLRKRHTIGTSIPVRYHPQQAFPEQEDSIKAIYGRPITLLIILVVVFVITLNAS
jgi:hypothetical protein